jgi:hypothetical protein
LSPGIDVGEGDTGTLNITEGGVANVDDVHVGVAFSTAAVAQQQ